MTDSQTIHGLLESAAWEATDNFCYECYKVVEGEFCPTCHTDDFMRHLEGVGVEYGIEWVIQALVHENCDPIGESELEDIYDEFLDEIYTEIIIGHGVYYPSRILQELDPVTYRIGKSEYFDDQVEEGILWEDENGKLYRWDDIESNVL